MLAPRRRPPTSSNLIDKQTSGDEEWIRQQEVTVGIRSRWVPSHSHTDMAKAKTKEERMEIKRNDEADRLPKLL